MFITKFRGAPVTVVLAALFFSEASLALGPARSLTRSEDHVVLSGEAAPLLIGARTRALHLFACGPGGFRAVPFQVDKRDKGGIYVYPNDTSRDPLRDGTQLDGNDELVFMAKDAGDSCADEPWVDGAVAAAEIELVDPLDHGRAWVYLFHRPGVDAPETEDYVSYRVEDGADVILSDVYVEGSPLQEIGLTVLKLRRPDGSWGRDILVGQKQGLIASLLKGSIPLYIPGRELRKRIVGVIDGPVRVVKGQLSFMRIKVIGYESYTEGNTFNYPNGHVNPIELDIPVNINSLFLSTDIYYTYCFNQAVYGSTFYDSANPRGIELDGRADPGMDLSSDNDYMAVTGPEGSLIVIMDLGNLKDHDVARTTLVHEEKTRDPPRAEPGEVMVGFWFKNTGRITKGKYNYCYYHFFPHPYTDHKVDEIKNMVEHPLEVRVKPMDGP
jgi:hypothetical protein